MTLKDIAKECGLAVSTVSNILNDHSTSYASAEVKARVRETARRLGYKKDYLSVSLRTRKTMSVGLVVDRIRSVTRQDFLTPFVERFSRAGYEVAVAEHGNDPARAHSALDAFAHRSKDAVVAFTDMPEAETAGAEALRATLEAYPGRLLGIGSQAAGRVPTLDIDRTHAINRSVAHLLKSHDKVVVAYGLAFDLRPRFEYWDHPRVELWQGVKTAVEFFSRYDAQGARAATGYFLRTDEVAVPVLGELRARGVAVPEAVEIIGFDNFPFAEYTSPALSTWDIGFHRLGERAQTLLSGWLGGHDLPKGTREEFLPVWVPRGTHRGTV